MNEYERTYNSNNIAQFSAAVELVNMIKDHSNVEKVLDIGCGSGRVSEFLYEYCLPRKMVCIDKSKTMIYEAKKNTNNLKIQYLESSIEDFNINCEFDVVFLNSSFQWFSDLNLSLKVIRKHLSDLGSVYIQTPFTKDWCPAINKVIDDFFCYEFPELKDEFTFPCTHLESDNEYVELFIKNGFSVDCVFADDMISIVDGDDFLKIFKSGAWKVYSNQDNFSKKLPDDYQKSLISFVRNYYDNEVEVIMPRLFVKLSKSMT